jgi:hypothetical protein
MNNFYVEQHAGFALGNFVALTPTIRFLSMYFNQKIKVKFNTEYVKQCYLDCSFIEIIDEIPLNHKRLFGSEMICRKNDKTDYEFVFENVLEMLNIEHNYTMPSPYVDKPTLYSKEAKYGVFINGSGSEADEYLDRKLIPNYFQSIIMENSKIPVIGTGSINDKERNIFSGPYGDIRKSLALINGAQWVISNVTGFYHVAGAMQKKQLVLRKNCLFPRCQNINFNSITSHKENWERSILEFLENN